MSVIIYEQSKHGSSLKQRGKSKLQRMTKQAKQKQFPIFCNLHGFSFNVLSKLLIQNE